MPWLSANTPRGKPVLGLRISYSGSGGGQITRLLVIFFGCGGFLSADVDIVSFVIDGVSIIIVDGFAISGKSRAGYKAGYGRPGCRAPPVMPSIVVVPSMRERRLDDLSTTVE